MGNNSSKGNAQSTADSKDSRRKNIAKTGSQESREANQQQQTSEVSTARTSVVPCQSNDIPREANHRPPPDNQEEIHAGEQPTQDGSLNFVDTHFSRSPAPSSLRKQMGGLICGDERVDLRSNSQLVTSATRKAERNTRSTIFGSRASLLHPVDEGTGSDAEVQHRVPLARLSNRNRSHSADDLLCEQHDVRFTSSDVDANSASYTASSYEDSNYYATSSEANSYASSTYAWPTSSRFALSRPARVQSVICQLPNSATAENLTFPQATQENFAGLSEDSTQIQTGRHHRSTMNGYEHTKTMSLSVSHLNQCDYRDDGQRTHETEVTGCQTGWLRQRKYARSCEQLDGPDGTDANEHIRRLSDAVRTLSQEVFHLSHQNLAISIDQQKLAQRQEEQDELLMKIRAPDNNVQARS